MNYIDLCKMLNINMDKPLEEVVEELIAIADFHNMKSIEHKKVCHKIISAVEFIERNSKLIKEKR